MQWILIPFRRKLYPLFLIGVVFISSPWFPGLHDDFCNFRWNSFLSILFPDTWQALNQKLGMFGGFLSPYGKYKQVWDFGSNNGSFVRILKSLVNQGCLVKRGTTKIPVADSNSILFITCGIQENGKCIKMFLLPWKWKSIMTTSFRVWSIRIKTPNFFIYSWWKEINSSRTINQSKFMKDWCL